VPLSVPLEADDDELTSDLVYSSDVVYFTCIKINSALVGFHFGTGWS
jgi:hypothetical protein